MEGSGSDYHGKHADAFAPRPAVCDNRSYRWHITIA